MDFVDVVNLRACATRSETGVLSEFTNLLNAVIARPVYFNNIDILPHTDRLADVAGVAGGESGPGLTVQAFGKDPSDRCLANSPSSAEEIGMSHPVHADRISECLNHVVLPYNLGEVLRPIPAGYHLIARAF